MRCVSCGEREAFYEGLCMECYSEKNPFTLEDDTIKICRECGAGFVGEWRKSASIEKYMQSILKGYEIVSRFTVVERNEATYSFHEEGDKYLIDVAQKKIISPGKLTIRRTSLSLEKRYTVCPACQKKKSGYFEAILQVRRMDGALSEIEKESIEDDVHSFVGKERDPLAFILHTKMSGEGMDFDIGGKKVARHAALFLRKGYGGKISESNKIMGRDKRTNKDILRLTIVLRLPPLQKGDHVVLEGEVFRVQGITDTIKLVNASGKRGITQEKIRELLKKGKMRKLDAMSERIIITSLTPDFVQVLRKDYSTTLVPRPKDLRIKVGEEYDVIFLEDRLFWV